MPPTIHGYGVCHRGRGKAGEMKKIKYGRAVGCLLLSPRKYVVAIPSRGWEREGRQFGPVIYTAVEKGGLSAR
jgi:hypothetical protein